MSRRLITASLNGQVTIWNFNSVTEITTMSFESASPIISVLEFVTIGTCDYLLRAGWDKVLTTYAESSKGHFELYRSFVGHKADISVAVGYGGGFISGSIDGQLI
jgi:hypothetical protein